MARLLAGLEKALRAYQLYEGNNPALDRFIEALEGRFAEFWKEERVIELAISEREMRWQTARVYRKEETADNLAFLFHRDGIRQISFHQGFETKDLRPLLAVLAYAVHSRRQHDDLITLLWNEDFVHFQYQYVDLLADGAELQYEGGGEPPEKVESEEVRAESAGGAAAGGIRPEDFREALYFLEPAELRRVEEMIRSDRRENHWIPVLHGLLDRFEDGSPERRKRVLAVIVEVLPLLLANRRFEEAALLLGELGGISDNGHPGSGGPDEELRGIFAQLAEPGTITELVNMLHDAPASVSTGAVGDFVGLLPPEALPALVRELVGAEGQEVGEVLQEAIAPLAKRSERQIVEMLSSDDPTLLIGSLRLVGALGMRSAARSATRLIGHPTPEVRIAAIRALSEVRSTEAGRGLVAALDDPDRDVRVQAAKGLAAIRYAPAVDVLRDHVTSRHARGADFTERMALFEAYGAVCGPEGVPVMDRILNGKKLFGRKETAEMRACAAIALGMIGNAEARRALQGAVSDPDPVVRSAASRALRGGGER